MKLNDKITLFMKLNNLQIPHNIDSFDIKKYHLHKVLRDGILVIYLKNNHEIELIWDKRGTLRSLTEYNEFGILDGKQYGYHTNGRLEYSWNYRNGCLFGEQYKFSEHGDLIICKDVNDDMIDIHDNGVLYWE